MPSSECGIESESESEYDNVEILEQHVEFQASLFSSTSIIYEYYMTYIMIRILQELLSSVGMHGY
jgi:hypothetical protein